MTLKELEQILPEHGFETVGFLSSDFHPFSLVLGNNICRSFSFVLYSVVKYFGNAKFGGSTNLQMQNIVATSVT